MGNSKERNMVACAIGRSPRVQPLWLVREPSQACRMHDFLDVLQHICNAIGTSSNSGVNSRALSWARRTALDSAGQMGLSTRCQSLEALIARPRGPCVTAIAITDGKMDKMGKIKDFQDLS